MLNLEKTECSSSNRCHLGRESSKKSIWSPPSSSVDGSKNSPKQLSLRRPLFAKAKSSSWSNRSHRDEHNVRKHPARNTNAELAAMKTLLEKYKIERQQTQQEVQCLQDENNKLASQLSRVSNMYHSVVDERYQLCSQLQTSQEKMDNMMRQLERVSSSCDPQHVSRTSSSSTQSSKRSICQGQETEHCRQQQPMSSEQSLVREYKERFTMPTLEGQESLPIARAIPFPCAVAVPVGVEASESVTAIRSRERTRPLVKPRAASVDIEGATCTKPVRQASRLDGCFRGLSMDHRQATDSPRSVASACRARTNEQALQPSGSSAFSRYRREV